MILQSARLAGFCHHRLCQGLHYTPMHQDDQGQPSLRSKTVLRSERRAAVSAVVSTGRGNDASYPIKTTGAAEGPVIIGLCGAGNYLAAVQKGGEPAGTRRFGFEWAYQPANKGQVITGFPEKAIARFSSRRAQITKTVLALADQY